MTERTAAGWRLGVPYIETLYEQQLPPKAHLRGVKIWSFPLRARYRPLKALVDRFLNLCRWYRFFPVWSPVALSSVVFLRILKYDRIQCLYPPYRDWGYFNQTEIFFAIPVVRWERGWPVQLALFCPLIFVDHPLSMVSGNMVLGYPKGQACFEAPDPGLHGCPTTVKIQAFKKHHQNSKMDWRRLLDVRGSVRLASDPPPLKGLEPGQLWPFGPVDPLFGPDGCLPLRPRTRHLFRALDSRDVLFSVQLRQVRALLHPRQASLQEVISVAMRREKLHGAEPLPPVTIRLHRHAGLDVQELLGLKGERGRLRPLYPHYVHLDMVGGNPQVLHP